VNLKTLTVFRAESPFLSYRQKHFYKKKLYSIFVVKTWFLAKSWSKKPIPGFSSILAKMAELRYLNDRFSMIAMHLHWWDKGFI